MKPIFTHYGRREILLCSTVCASACFALAAAARGIHPLWAIGLVVPGTLWAWVLWFFRDPQRDTPQGKGLLIAPADGVVTDITQVGDRSPLGCDGVKIGIFMSVFDVHVNRSPAEARVVKVEHVEGLFLDARDENAGEKNESATIHLTIENDKGESLPLVVRQVAGLIARRIVTDLQPGQHIQRGERIGMIKFGSRLEIFVPTQLVHKVLVAPGQKTRAGLTVLATSGE